MGIIFPTDHASGIMPVLKTRFNYLTYTSCIYQFADYLKSIHYFTHKAGSVGSQLKYLVYIDWILFCPECFIFSNTQEGHSFS